MTERIISPVAALGDAFVIENRAVAERSFLLELALEGELAALAPAPGRFYQVRCGAGKEHMLRRPLSALGFTPGERASLRFLVDVVGWGTGFLAGLEAGATVSLLGPLGRGFDTSGTGKALLVGGGVGIAPLCHLAAGMEAAGREYEFVAGFATDARRPRGVLPEAVEIYTEDGSGGRRGTACDGVEAAVRRGCAEVFTCGPEEMMSEVASIAGRHGIACQASLDERMACGLGACRGCVKEGAGGRNLCVCLEGPVIDGGRHYS